MGKVSAILNQASQLDTATVRVQEIRVHVRDEQSDFEINVERSQALCEMVLGSTTVGNMAVGNMAAGPLELSVTFISLAVMTELNEQHMGTAGPTDVLAFPLEAGQLRTGQPEAGQPGAGPSEIGRPEIRPEIRAGLGPEASSARRPPVLLGDIVVCPSVAHNNAGARVCGAPASVAQASGALAAGAQATGAQASPPADPFVAEIDTLVVHGLLHLLGMDHAEAHEAELMFAQQAEHLNAFWRCQSGPGEPAR